MPRPTEPTVYFVDRSLGSLDVPEALRKAGVHVETHDDHFDQATEDQVWLGEVGARGWVVLTKDARIRRHPLELNALTAAGVAAFILTAGGLTGRQMADTLVRALPKIEAVVRTRARPFVATITRSGAVHVVVGGSRKGGVKRR